MPQKNHRTNIVRALLLLVPALLLAVPVLAGADATNAVVLLAPALVITALACLAVAVLATVLVSDRTPVRVPVRRRSTDLARQRDLYVPTHPARPRAPGRR